MEEKEAAAKSAVASTPTPTTQTRHRRHLYRHRPTTIEGARKELDEAKQRVLELEDLIKCLEKNGEDSKEKQSSSNDDSCHKALQGNTLRLALEFLGIKDVVSCSKVCQQWENDIDTNPQTWKKALENDGWGSFVHDLETRFRSSSSSSSSSEEEEESSQPSQQSTSLSTSPMSKSSSDRPSLPPDYYKNIALGIIRDREQATQNDKDRVLGYKPKLNPKDIFLVLEVKDKYSGEIIGVFNRSLPDNFHEFACSFTGNDSMFLPATLDEGTFEDHYHGFGCWDPWGSYLSRRRPFENIAAVKEYYQLQWHGDFVPLAIHKSMSFTFRFFRCDTGQSIYWDFGQGENERRVEAEYVPLHMCELVSYAKKPDSMNESGVIARDVWSTEEYTGMHAYLFYAIKPVYPENEDIANNDSWRHTRFRFDTVDIRFLLDDGPPSNMRCGQTFNSMRDLMLSLEGLVWR